ncbi:MAG: hypothetical protein K6T86_20345, partial [Pirellulales bacterium]|nr:hypothetical protein [Pirellulales bacterium]
MNRHIGTSAANRPRQSAFGQPFVVYRQRAAGLQPLLASSLLFECHTVIRPAAATYWYLKNLLRP